MGAKPWIKWELVSPGLFQRRRQTRKAMSLEGDEKLLWGVVHNAGHLTDHKTPRWAAVSKATGCGRTVAQELCLRFDADPEEYVGATAADGEI